MTVRHQANRKLSKWQLVANGELLIFKMAVLSIFPLLHWPIGTYHHGKQPLV